MKAMYFTGIVLINLALLILSVARSRADEPASIYGEWTNESGEFVKRQERWKVGQNTIKLEINCGYPDQSQSSGSIEVPVVITDSLITVKKGKTSVILSKSGQSSCIAQIDEGKMSYNIKDGELSLQRVGDEPTVLTSAHRAE